jgi:hypothetical protein
VALPALCRSVSIGVYVAAVKVAKANQSIVFRHTLEHWGPGSGARILGEFRKGLDERISAGHGYRSGRWSPAPPRGRKDCPDWFLRAYRDSRRIRAHQAQRVAIHQFETDEARRRFGHLLTPWNDG